LRTPVPNVARPSPAFVNPPEPDMAPVRFNEPADDDAVVLFTVAVTESFSVIVAEMVTFPDPAPPVVMLAPAPPLLKINGPPEAPLGIPMVFVVRVVKDNEPTVIPPPGELPTRLAETFGTPVTAGVEKMAEAPTPLGIVPSTQVELLVQLSVPPLP
ncbi:MAG: hypothetical protein ABIO94_02990, partial [Opitutaceae bacterium]